MARNGHTQEEIAARQRVSVDTITARYSDTIKEGRAYVSGSIRSELVRIALSRDGVDKNGERTQEHPKKFAALVWLSKQYCGFSDKVEQKVEETQERKVTYTAKWGDSSEPNGGSNESKD